VHGAVVGERRATRRPLFGHLLPSRGERMASRRGVAAREIPLEGRRSLARVRTRRTSGVRVHLFHGLSATSTPITCAARRACSAQRGHSVWASTTAVAAAVAASRARPYHSGSSAACRPCSREPRVAPDHLHVVIAFSLSGNIALLHAA